jgi:hypothetical protein
MIRWLIDFRFAVHYGLNPDIARRPKTCTKAEVGGSAPTDCQSI